MEQPDGRRLLFSVDVLDGSPAELAEAVDKIGGAIMGHPLVVRVIAPDHRNAARVDIASGAAGPRGVVHLERERRSLQAKRARLDAAEKEARESAAARPLRDVLADRRSTDAEPER